MVELGRLCGTAGGVGTVGQVVWQGSAHDQYPPGIMCALCTAVACPVQMYCPFTPPLGLTNVNDITCPPVYCPAREAFVYESASRLSRDLIGIVSRDSSGNSVHPAHLLSQKSHCT